jgi:hypothetical protein
MPTRRRQGRKTPHPPADKAAATLKAYVQALGAVGWRKRNQGLWLQAQRVGKLIAIQCGLPDELFPPGCCFIHANVPTVNSFCVRRIVEVDLNAATLLLEIHGDEELEEGHVVLPLESIGWFGFPAKAVPVGTVFTGFALPAGEGPSPVVVHPPG